MAPQQGTWRGLVDQGVPSYSTTRPLPPLVDGAEVNSARPSGPTPSPRAARIDSSRASRFGWVAEQPWVADMAPLSPSGIGERTGTVPGMPPFGLPGVDPPGDSPPANPPWTGQAQELPRAQTRTPSGRNPSWSRQQPAGRVSASTSPRPQVGGERPWTMASSPRAFTPRRSPRAPRAPKPATPGTPPPAGAAVPVAGASVQQKQRGLFEALHETIRQLRASKQGVEERLRVLESENRLLRSGSIYPE
jgi:hypothetical protein